MPKLFAGLDVADKTTAICVVDERGKVVNEVTAATTPEAIAKALKPYRRSLKAVGQEAGIKAAWLHRGLLRAKIPIHSLDPRHAHAALKMRLNKTDANDAFGLACLMAGGIFASAHIKSEEIIRIRIVLSLRDALVRQSVSLRLSLRMGAKLIGNEGLVAKLRTKPSARGDFVSSAASSILRAIEHLDVELSSLDRIVADIVDDYPVCARLMAIPGVGAITALTFVAAVDDPQRFRVSRDLGPYFGLSPRTFQSGEVRRSGGISHRGDRNARRVLFNAARIMLTNSRSQCSLRMWGLRIKDKKGLKVAATAVARKLAVLMHRLWVTGEEFDPAR
jgi:transposase